MILDKLKAVFKPNPDLTKPITELNLTTRTHDILRKSGVATVGDLAQLSRKNLKGCRGVVRRTVMEVERVLDDMGLGLRKE